MAEHTPGLWKVTAVPDLLAALPDPEKLELLASWIDVKHADNPDTEVQDDLRRWAAGIRAAIEKATPDLTAAKT